MTQMLVPGVEWSLKNLKHTTLALEQVGAGELVTVCGGWRKGDPCHLGIDDKLSPMSRPMSLRNR